jgi:WD40 repeat protein
VTGTDSERLLDLRNALTWMPRTAKAPGLGGTDGGSWFARCSAAVGEPGLAAGLLAALAPGQDVAAALNEDPQWPGGAGPREEGPLLSAARALLNVVLAVDYPDHAGSRLADALAHWRRACVIPTGAAPALSHAVSTGPRVARALESLTALAEDTAVGYAQLVLLSLAGTLQPVKSLTQVSVVFGNKDSGKLTLRVQPGGPAGLYPDPRRMAFFAADGTFADALGRAWSTCPLALRSQCVLWDIGDTERPFTEVTGPSLAAAFGIGLIELRRGRNWLSYLNPRALNPRCAITGDLDLNGTLQPVGEYEDKLQAADRRHWRLVVPKNDPEAVKHPEIKVKIAPAKDLREAVRLSRRTRPTHYLAAGVAVLLVAAFLITNSIENANSEMQVHLADLRAIATRTSSEAYQVFNSDEPTGLLLAMASDGIAASAGETTNTFVTLAENDADLVKIERPPAGRFSLATVSADGTLALLQNDAGYVGLVSGLNGDVLWSHAYMPDAKLAPGQVYLSGMAIASNDDYAAYASSDGRIQLLGDSGQAGWRELASVAEPWKSAPSNFGDLNTAWSLSFSPNGQQLLASDDKTVAVYNVSASGLGTPSQPCQLPQAIDKAQEAAASTTTGLLQNLLTATGPDQALFVSARLVYKLDLATCQGTPAMTLPAGASAVQAFESGSSTDGVQAVATDGNSVILYQQGQQPVTVANLAGLDDGNVFATKDEDGNLIVTATGNQGTYVYDATANALDFQTSTAATAVSANGIVILINDTTGQAQIRSASGGVIGYVNTFYNPQIIHLAWAGNGTLVAGLTNGVATYSNVTKPTGVPLAAGNPVQLPGSTGTTPYALAASPSAPLAAAVLGTGDLSAGNPTTVAAWNVADNRQQMFPATPSGYRADSVTFTGASLLVGYAHDGNGLIREFALNGSSWTLRGQVTVGGAPVALSASGGTLYALTSTGETARPTLRELALQPGGQLRQSGSALLAGTGIGQVRALPGGVIASTGAGATEELTADLRQLHATTVPNMSAVTGIAPIPDSDEVMIIGTDGAVVLKQSTLGELGSNAWARAGGIETAAADPVGPYFATGAFLAGQFNIWSLSPRTLKQEACAAIGTNLTRAQWDQYIGSTVPYQLECPS